VDEALDDFYKNNNLKVIVVGIDNGGSERTNELTPWENATYGDGKGDLYTDFIVETLKPYIDQNYRTLNDASNTTIGGSSFGVLISFYGALRNPEVFGNAIVFSPSFWFSDKCYDFTNEKALNKN